MTEKEFIKNALVAAQNDLYEKTTLAINTFKFKVNNLRATIHDGFIYEYDDSYKTLEDDLGTLYNSLEEDASKKFFELMKSVEKMLNDFVTKNLP